MLTLQRRALAVMSPPKSKLQARQETYRQSKLQGIEY
jgi:hypothetical protein